MVGGFLYLPFSWICFSGDFWLFSALRIKGLQRGLFFWGASQANPSFPSFPSSISGWERCETLK